jgi:hypothetical protein
MQEPSDETLAAIEAALERDGITHHANTAAHPDALKAAYRALVADGTLLTRRAYVLRPDGPRKDARRPVQRAAVLDLMRAGAAERGRFYTATVGGIARELRMHHAHVTQALEALHAEGLTDCARFRSRVVWRLVGSENMGGAR